MEDKLVSVIIPTYNREEDIRSCIESVQDQTYSNLEIIVVDDCSSDETEDVVRSIEDDRIKLIKHDKNKGAGAARNTGLAHADGEYIAFLDSDDRWISGKLEKQIEDLEYSSKDTKISYCGRYSRFAGSSVLMKTDMDVREGDVYKDLLKGWMDATTSQLVIHRSCFEKAGDFDSSFASFQEYDLLVRMAEHFKFVYTSQHLVENEVGGPSISSSYSNRMKGLERFLEKNRERLESVESASPEKFFETRITDIKGNEMVHKLSNRQVIDGLSTFKEYYHHHDSILRPLMLLGMALVLDEGSIGKIANIEKVVTDMW